MSGRSGTFGIVQLQSTAWPPKMQAVWSFRWWEPLAQWHSITSPEDLNVQ